MTVCVVIGMHKSGTTLVSQALHRSGFSMVDDDGLSDCYDTGQKYERQSFQDLNRQLLCCDDDRSLRIDLNTSRSHWPSLDRRARELVGTQAARHERWGFKDPRTTLTYPFWQAALPRHALIGVYRDPREVWAHYRARDTVEAQLALVFDHWLAYNSLLADYVTGASTPAIVLSFGDLLGDRSAWARLGDFLGRDVTDVSDHRLHRSLAGARRSPELPPQATSLLRRLDRLASR